MPFDRAIPIGGDPRRHQTPEQAPHKQQVTVVVPEGHMHLIEIGFNASIHIFPDGEFIWNGAILLIPKGYRAPDVVVRNVSSFGHPIIFSTVPIPTWWENRCEKGV